MQLAWLVDFNLIMGLSTGDQSKGYFDILKILPNMTLCYQCRSLKLIGYSDMMNASLHQAIHSYLEVKLFHDVPRSNNVLLDLQWNQMWHAP